MKLQYFTFLYLFTIFSSTTADKANGPPEKLIQVTEGEDIRLKCNVDRSKLKEDLVWKTGSIVIASGNAMSLKSERFEPETVSNTLIIYNATSRDNRKFSCSDTSRTYSVFNVTVNELMCKDVDKLPNGLIQYTSQKDDNGMYKQGTKLTYQCNAGYTLIGATTRHCSSPTTKWTGTRATCKDLHVVSLEKKIQVLEKSIENLLAEVKKAQEEDKTLTAELGHQYSLWEYLLYEFSSYKTHTEDTAGKLEIEIDHLYRLLRRRSSSHSGRGYGHGTSRGHPQHRSK